MRAKFDSPLVEQRAPDAVALAEVAPGCAAPRSAPPRRWRAACRPASSSSTRRAEAASSSARSSDRQSMACDISTVGLLGLAARAPSGGRRAPSRLAVARGLSALAIQRAGLAADVRQRRAGTAGQVLHQVPVAQPPRVEPLRLTERCERLAPPVAVEVGEPEQVVRLLESRIEAHRLGEAPRSLADAAHLVEAVAEQVERLRHRVERAGALEIGHGAAELAFRQRRSRRGRSAAGRRRSRSPPRASRSSSARATSPRSCRMTPEKTSASNWSGARLEHAHEVAERVLGLALVEGGLGQQQRQLVVPRSSRDACSSSWRARSTSKA